MESSSCRIAGGAGDGLEEELKVEDCAGDRLAGESAGGGGEAVSKFFLIERRRGLVLETFEVSTVNLAAWSFGGAWESSNVFLGKIGRRGVGSAWLTFISVVLQGAFSSDGYRVLGIEVFTFSILSEAEHEQKNKDSSSFENASDNEPIRFVYSCALSMRAKNSRQIKVMKGVKF